MTKQISNPTRKGCRVLQPPMTVSDHVQPLAWPTNWEAFS